MLNERIRELREATGLTQVELARKLSVTKQSVSNWENNNIQPSVEMVMALADFFGVSVDYLLGRSDKRQLSVEGLTDTQIQHIHALVQDILNGKKEKPATVSERCVRYRGAFYGIQCANSTSLLVP